MVETPLLVDRYGRLLMRWACPIPSGTPATRQPLLQDIGVPHVVITQAWVSDGHQWGASAVRGFRNMSDPIPRLTATLGDVTESSVAVVLPFWADVARTMLYACLPPRSTPTPIHSWQIVLAQEPPAAWIDKWQETMPGRQAPLGPLCLYPVHQGGYVRIPAATAGGHI